MTPSSTVLILGARGRFGRAATHAFASAGWTVLAQRRSPAAGRGAVNPAVRWVDLDVRDTAALAIQAGQASVVVHAMSPAYTNSAWRKEAPEQMRGAIAIANVLGALLMFPGNVYNFGATMPALLREDTPQRPTNVKGQVRVALERQLEEAAQEHGLASAVIRAGDFFGSGTGSLFDRVLVPKLAKGRMGYAAGLHIPTAWAYLPDLAQTFVRVAQQRALLRGAQTFHFHGYQLTGQDWRDVMTPVARSRGWLAANAQLKVDALPWPLLRALGLVMPTMQSLAETRYIWNTPHALDGSRLQALIGDEPHTPLAQAVEQSLADLLAESTEQMLRTA